MRSSYSLALTSSNEGILDRLSFCSIQHEETIENEWCVLDCHVRSFLPFWNKYNYNSTALQLYNSTALWLYNCTALRVYETTTVCHEQWLIMAQSESYWIETEKDNRNNSMVCCDMWLWCLVVAECISGSGCAFPIFINVWRGAHAASVKMFARIDEFGNAIIVGWFYATSLMAWSSWLASYIYMYIYVFIYIIIIMIWLFFWQFISWITIG